ncbi:MAG: M48 metallopeptidase family protein [Acidimicrobiales bacterium]
MHVEVIRSAKRRKTVQARMVDGVLQLSIPARMSKAEEQHWIEVMTKRLARRSTCEEIDLTARASRVAVRFGLPEPTTIRWVDNQHTRWGSCTPVDGSIRISSRLAAFPDFVLDHVLVHELAHLVHFGHGPEFKALIARDPMAERAKGFLMAKGMGDADEPQTEPEIETEVEPRGEPRSSPHRRRPRRRIDDRAQGQLDLGDAFSLDP